MSMEASEIVRRNEAIAKFMGCEDPKWEGKYIISNEGGMYHMGSDSLAYHKYYSWLMPVVEKILTHRTSMIGSMGTLIREESGEFTVMLAGGNIGKEPTMIDAIFLAVSEYCLAL